MIPKSIVTDQPQRLRVIRADGTRDFLLERLCEAKLRNGAKSFVLPLNVTMQWADAAGDG